MKEEEGVDDEATLRTGAPQPNQHRGSIIAQMKTLISKYKIGKQEIRGKRTKQCRRRSSRRT